MGRLLSFLKISCQKPSFQCPTVGKWAFDFRRFTHSFSEIGNARMQIFGGRQMLETHSKNRVFKMNLFIKIILAKVAIALLTFCDFCFLGVHVYPH